tara:strand:+ start:1101 stop:2411 length:1311 start_codon:yes stop_codon:yes gene_type:complete
MATYDEILKQIQTSQDKLDPSSISVSQKSPQLEALMGIYGPELANVLKSPIDLKKAGALPQAAGQNQLQQQAIQMQLNQAGYGQANFGNEGQFTGIQGASAANPYGNTAAGGQATGIGGYQQYLNNASAAGQAAQDMIIDPVTGQARPAPSADAIASAANYGDLAGQAAIAGQGASDPYTQAAQGYTGANAYQQFMSPYQQEVIDATQADMSNQLQQQQAQLGASAGNAFGGGRFGVAEGQLAASGALGSALAGAQLRQQGFGMANQLANQAFGQQMNMGTQAMQQAGQNQNAYSQAQQNQLATGQAQSGQFQTQLGNFGAQQQAQQGLATLQPQLAAQQIGAIGQMGAQQQAQQQAILDTTTQQNKMQAYEPYDRMGFFGSQLTGLLGGYPQGNTFSSVQQQQPSPTAGILGLLTGVGSLATGIGSMMGNRPVMG